MACTPSAPPCPGTCPPCTAHKCPTPSCSQQCLGCMASAAYYPLAQNGVRALSARQRRRRALCAVRARLAGDARLLALVGLVLASRTLVARALASDGLDGAGAALGLLSAARWREVACDGLRAAAGAGEAGGDGVRALRARQRRRRALCAVRARLAGDARLLTLAGLVLTGCTLVARALAGDGLDGAGAALGLLSAARWREVARGGLRAAAGAGEAGGDGVRALRARQRRCRALRAVRAALASNARLLTLAGLVLTGLALETRAHACAGSDGAGAAGCLLRATRRCVKAWGCGLALSSAAEVSGTRVRPPATRQRRPCALRAKGAALARARARCGSRRALVLARDASGASHAAVSVSHAPWEAVDTRGGRGTSRHLVSTHRAGLTGFALEAKAAVCSPGGGVVGAGRALLAVDCGAAAEAASRALLAAARADGCIELPRRTSVATCTGRTLSVLPWEARQANHTRRTVGMLTELAGGAALCRPCALESDPSGRCANTQALRQPGPRVPSVPSDTKSGTHSRQTDGLLLPMEGGHAKQELPACSWAPPSGQCVSISSSFAPPFAPPLPARRSSSPSPSMSPKATARVLALPPGKLAAAVIGLLAAWTVNTPEPSFSRSVFAWLFVLPNTRSREPSPLTSPKATAVVAAGPPASKVLRLLNTPAPLLIQSSLGLFVFATIRSRSPSASTSPKASAVADDPPSSTVKVIVPVLPWSVQACPLNWAARRRPSARRRPAGEGGGSEASGSSTSPFSPASGSRKGSGESSGAVADAAATAAATSGRSKSRSPSMSSASATRRRPLLQGPFPTADQHWPPPPP
eukprot:scaffold49370_cov69-Phaeocystis_antarctica.AAC.2